MNVPARKPMSATGTVPGRAVKESRTLRIAREIGYGRVAASVVLVLLALMLARFSWGIPLARDAERALYDFRAILTAPYVDQDPRIIMVVYTDETLAATGKRSPLDRKLLGDALTRIDRMGAKAIGIDILVDQPQPEDETLRAAFRGMTTPTFLGFASNATNRVFMASWQEEFLRTFLGSLAPGNVKPTSIRLQADSDNIARSWPDQPADVPPLLANSLAPTVHPEFRRYQGSIGYRLQKFDDRPVFLTLPIDLFGSDEAAAAMADQVRDRYVLIGGDISDIDRFDTPATRLSGVQTSGLEVHATLLAQMLDGRRFTAIPGWLLWIGAIVVIGAAAATVFIDTEAWQTALLMLGQAVLILVIPFVAHKLRVDTQQLPMFGWIAGWVLAFIALGSAARALGSQQKRFAEGALGKYLPADVAKLILDDPERLSLHGEKREIYALFSDLEGFTKLSHALEPEMVAYLLNTYLDTLSDIVLAHGGTIDKFVGDAVVAFWGAPISREDDGVRAAQAAVAMFKAGEQFRADAPPGVPPLGVTRIGLHKGEAIVGNFGGEDRIQYTALGDSMNTAARLEGANKYLKTTVLVSETVLGHAGAMPLRPMGRIVVSGRSTPLAIYEPTPDTAPETFARFVELYRRFDAGDSLALDELREYVAAHPDDRAAANLVYRLEQVGPGGSYVLESK